MGHRPEHTTSESGGGAAATKQALLATAARLAGDYVAGERERRVSPASGALDALRTTVDGVDLDEPMEPSAVLELVAAIGEAGAVRSTGGRYFGFVNGGVSPVGLATSVLSAAWDQNVALPVMSPAGSLLDGAAARLVVEILNLPSGAVASFCAGATIANITAVVTARDALLRRMGWDPAAEGLRGAPPIEVVTSSEAHVSVLKALRIAGFGRGDIRFVPTDEAGRLIASELSNLRGPSLVLLQAGNVNTGGFDPFDEVADRLEGAEAWIHVDGAFGLWAAASSTRNHHLAGVERADSWATDAHKWLNSPYDCGVVICKDPEALTDAMSMSAAYVATAQTDRTPMNLGLQMSQGARAVPVFAALATEGRAGVARIVDRTCDLASRFANGLAAAGATVLAPVVLNQALVAFGEDATTAAVIDRVQAGGECWMGGTSWHGSTAMRISVSDASTTPADVDASVDAVLTAWDEVSRSS
jgi:glutamate/tyrosine decarboxylase-like PLP-dependent enzyme